MLVPGEDVWNTPVIPGDFHLLPQSGNLMICQNFICGSIILPEAGEGIQEFAKRRNLANDIIEEIKKSGGNE
jgi:hypothetical protein